MKQLTHTNIEVFIYFVNDQLGNNSYTSLRNFHVIHFIIFNIYQVMSLATFGKHYAENTKIYVDTKTLTYTDRVIYAS